MRGRVVEGRKQNAHLARRDFLKTAAAGAGGAALAGFGASEAGSVQLSEVRKWDYEAGIVVLGTGGSGLATAIVARDLGTDVLMLEKAKESHAGGNSRVSMQGIWCPPDYNQAMTYQRALNDGYPVPEDVIEAYHQYTIKNPDWLRKIGAQIIQPASGNASRAEYPEFPGAESAAVCFLDNGKGQAGPGFQRLWTMLRDSAVKRQITIIYETPGIELIQDPKTREIRGVLAERQGKRINVKAKKAVVLCTGGFENNQEMIRDYLSMPCGYPFGTPYNTGDGIRMAMAVGADLWHMDSQAGPTLSFKPPDFDFALGGGGAPRTRGFIWVAKDGTRFINENTPSRHGKIAYHGTFIQLPTPLPIHSIFDETGRRSGPLFTLGGNMGWNAMIERYKWSDDNSVELAKGWIIKADTIRELAAKIGKNPDTLEKTIATWNRSCAAGNDSEFGRASDRIAPIQSPPYYALELVPMFTNTQGGPRRNKNAQILDPYGKPIPRLYSAGELGSIWSWHYQGAGDFAECLAFGRIAGEHAAAEKPWS